MAKKILPAIEVDAHIGDTVYAVYNGEVKSGIVVNIVIRYRISDLGFLEGICEYYTDTQLNLRENNLYTDEESAKNSLVTA